MSTTNATQLQTNAGVAAAMALEAADVQLIDVAGALAQVAVLPTGRTLESLDKFLPQPTRRKGGAVLFDPQSLVSYVRRFATPRGVIAADVQTVSIRAFLDYHEGGEGGARHTDFQATYTLRETEDWTRWKASNAKPMAQVAFAQFLEDNLTNIAEPDGTTLLDICQNLHVRTDVTFKSAIRLTDGTAKLTYEENTEGATKGDLRLPTSIVLGVIPFEGAEQFRVDARLRYRVNAGAATFWYELVRPDKVVEQAFRDVETVVKDGLADMNLLWIQGKA